MKNQPLFIFEMANNHMGDAEHGIRIVQEFRKVTEGFPFRFAVKLQYRDITTCIHPAYCGRTDLKYIKRFTETALTWEQYKRLKDAIVEAGFLSICTPWDEPSVDKIVEYGFDFLKIPSCYITDWPLLERIAKENLPIIASTAGASLEDVDRVVSFFTHRGKRLSLMHCVGEYPAEDGNLNLGQIALLKKRYPGIEVGYSTHERPNNYEAVKIALALGAMIFEKHVALKTEKYSVNAYSVTPFKARIWLQSALEALEMIGKVDRRYQVSDGEREALSSLARGAFVKEAVAAGEAVKPSNVFFAMPRSEDQLVAQNFSKYRNYTAVEAIEPHGAVLEGNVKSVDTRETILSIVRDVKAVIKMSKVPVPGQCELEISHHYGIENFRTKGITAITVVNREYCKRLLVVLPGQSHPEQWHDKKDETYHILYGEVTVMIDGTAKLYKANDVVTITHGALHSFWTNKGTVIEEISSSYAAGDSFYTDTSIMRNQNRKTFVSFWME
jgi:sialic acid synthase SpsE/mannose-6-phosphate isomerase-like protein (cupin superfamily)